jgi:ribosome-associated protein
MPDHENDADADAPEPIRLDHFLKSNHLSGSGGIAKLLIQNGEVRVNGEVETRRRRKLKSGDVVDFGGSRFTV